MKPSKETDSRDNDELKPKFCNFLMADKNRIKIESIRKMRNKGLITEFDGKSDLEIVRESKLSEIGLRAELPKKAGPTIIMYDVEKSLPKEEITEQLWLKNINDQVLGKSISKEEIRFRFSIKTKNPDKIN